MATITDPQRDALEQEIHRVGGDLAAAFPSAARHPMRAIDARAMELASSDQELKAALFRFVDVVPACRSLDDLARHLTGFLSEVSDTTPPITVAMRKFLADRFKVTVHTEMRDLDAYALVMVKSGTPGPALKPSTTDCKALMEQARQGKLPPGPPQVVDGIMPCSMLGRIGQISMDGFEMKQAASMFVGQAGRPVVDRTGLTGNWRFLLTYFQERPANLPPEANVPATDPNAPSFFTAIQEQLGLNLESTKAPLEVTVIDSAEHPTDD